MHNKDPNIYKKARLSTCLTQEAAAEALHLSVESVKAYEAGQRIPPTETVALMADAYDAEWLKLLHLRAAAAPLEILPDKVGALPLANAVLQLVNRAYRFAQADSAHILVDIAEDGVINQAERVEFDRIMGELDGIVAAALSLKCCVTFPGKCKKKSLRRKGGDLSMTLGIFLQIVGVVTLTAGISRGIDYLEGRK